MRKPIPAVDFQGDRNASAMVRFFYSRESREGDADVFMLFSTPSPRETHNFISVPLIHREVVSRLLKDFERQGKLALDRSTVSLLPAPQNPGE